MVSLPPAAALVPGATRPVEADLARGLGVGASEAVDFVRAALGGPR